MATNPFQNLKLSNLSSAISDVDKKLQEISQKNPTSPDQMTSEQLKAAGYTLGTTTTFDGEGGYYEVPAWLDPKGNAANFNTSQIQRNDYQAAADKRRTEEIQGNFTYIPIGGDEEGGIPPTDYIKVPNAKIGYETPQNISRNAVFQDVNAFSGGQLGKITDAINSGQYKITDDKSQMVTKYGTYNLTPLGNGLYDIPIGARVGSYNVAIGVNDKGQAIFDQNFLDNGAVRYRGGSPGGALGNFVRDVGPVGNIALAVATGGMSIPEQIAAQTAYNMVGGADFEDALAKGALTAGVSAGIGSLTNGADLGSMNPDDYAGLGSGAGGDYGISPGGATADLAAASGASSGIGSLYGQGEGAFPGVEPGTVASDVAGTSGGIGTLYGQGEGTFPGATEGTVASDQGLVAPAPDTTIYGQGEGAFPGPTEGTVASDQGLFAPTDSGMIYGQGEGAFPGATEGTVASDIAGTGIDTGIVGGVGGGIGLSDALKYAGLASLVGGLLGGGKTAGGGGGVDQTPVGAGLSPDYKPYRYQPYAMGGITALAGGGYNLGGYSDGGRLLRGPGDGVSDDIPASIGGRQPARLANNEFVIPARIVSEIGNGSTDAGARALYAMMDRVQKRRQKTMGKGKFAVDTKANKELEKL